MNAAVLNNVLKRDCVRLRGLPYEAQVQQVVDFLGTHSRNIVFQVILFNNYKFNQYKILFFQGSPYDI